MLSRDDAPPRPQARLREMQTVFSSISQKREAGAPGFVWVREGCFVGECDAMAPTKMPWASTHLPTPIIPLIPPPPSLSLSSGFNLILIPLSADHGCVGVWVVQGGDRERGGGEEEVATHREILRGALMKRERERERERERQRGMPRRKQVSSPLSKRGVRAMSPFASRAGVARAVLSERSGGIRNIVTSSSLLSS